MKRILFFIATIILAISCKKEDTSNTYKKEGIISYISQDNCGYLLWIDNNMFKMVNDYIINDSCKNRYYTDVNVEYELLNTHTTISCPVYTQDTQAVQIRLITISGK
jgi:hypothetical protein